MKKPKKPTKKKTNLDRECDIPPPLPPEAASPFIVSKDKKGTEDVLGYMSREAPDEQVQHLEKIKSEKVLGARYDVWDVYTDKRRWWVITNPMNLYSHEHSPSLDYTLSFHIGLAARVAAKRENDFISMELYAAAWRKFQQAADAYDQADEPEEYQSVGMRCREALLAFIKEAASPELVPPKDSTPKAGDFVSWIPLIVNHWVSGSSSKELRSYLKNTAKLSWQLVNWLTHSANANNHDAEIAINATENILYSLTCAFIRYSKGFPGRCSICGSYKISKHFVEQEMAYQPFCAACGWEGELDPIT